MWILLWVMDLNSKSHIQQLKALRNVFLVSFTLASHITKIQRVKMNHGLMLHKEMSRVWKEFEFEERPKNAPKRAQKEES